MIKLIRTTAVILFAALLGYCVRICIDVLASRTGGPGGELLVILALPVMLVIGAVWGHDWALAKHGVARLWRYHKDTRRIERERALRSIGVRR